MPDSRPKTRRRGAPPRVLRAAVLLVVIAACLVSVILLLPPRRGEAPVETAETAETAEPAVPEAAQPSPGIAEPTPERPAEAAPPEKPERAGRLAVVIDDLGYSLENLEPFLASELPLSLSVLPGLPHSAEAARLVRSAGKQLLLHLPMEARNGADPGPGAVLTAMSDEAVRELLRESLSEVPAVGVNNHMGSAATADPRIMTAVLGYLKGRGLFFLDSRTTADSVAAAVAGELAEPILARDVFLDNDPSADAILAQLWQGAGLAERRGQAVLIGHVQNPQIVRLLEEALPELERRGLRLVHAGDLVAASGE